jgi:purine-binding chemotaxis protein CheW
MNDNKSNDGLLANGTDTEQFLSFYMAEEEYAVNILDVVEIRCIEKMTPLPTAPIYLKGLINLRGTIIPIMDLRQRFNIPTVDYTQTTVCIILQNSEHVPSKILGIIVDTVSDVYDFNSSALKDAPSLMGDDCSEYICGLATIEKDNEKKMVIVLNVGKLIDGSDISHLVDEAKHESS